MCILLKLLFRDMKSTFAESTHSSFEATDSDKNKVLEKLVTSVFTLFLLA